MDFDGDKALEILEDNDNPYTQVFFESYKKRPLIVSHLKNKPAKTLYDNAHILHYTMATLGNRTGVYTNINTYLLSQLYGRYNLSDTAKQSLLRDVAVMTIAIGSEIDYVKTFTRMRMPERLLKMAGKLLAWNPKAIGTDRKVEKYDTALQRLYDYCGSKIQTVDNMVRKYKHIDTSKILRSEHVSDVSEKAIFNAVIALEREYRLGIKDIMDKLYEMRIAGISSDELEEYESEVKKSFYDKIQAQANAITTDKQALANVAVKISYNLNDNESFSFPWIVAYEGLLMNLIENQSNDNISTRLIDITKWYPSSNNVDGYVINVVNNKIADAAGHIHNIDMLDGAYNIIRLYGKHFMVYNHKLTDNDKLDILRHYFERIEISDLGRKGSNTHVKKVIDRVEDTVSVYCPRSEDNEVIAYADECTDAIIKAGYKVYLAEVKVKGIPRVGIYAGEMLVGIICQDKAVSKTKTGYVDYSDYIGRAFKVTKYAKTHSVRTGFPNASYHLGIVHQGGAWYHNCKQAKFADYGLTPNIYNDYSTVSLTQNDGTQYLITVSENLTITNIVRATDGKVFPQISKDGILDATILRYVEYMRNRKQITA